jgi:hypothetical protein
VHNRSSCSRTSCRLNRVEPSLLPPWLPASPTSSHPQVAPALVVILATRQDGTYSATPKPLRKPVRMDPVSLAVSDPS